ncbi:hypothetical protein BYT27DRAFT_7202964 [Phlegmacium glaucopus]|nr:hypothetical protein BYT27DRAFT_7202964 [Phlegmacium glaucopus]
MPQQIGGNSSTPNKALEDVVLFAHSFTHPDSTHPSATAPCDPLIGFHEGRASVFEIHLPSHM